MPFGKVDLRCDRKDFSANGQDDVEFLISANRGESPKPMARIASGGELSRIMLAMKNVLSEKEKTYTMIFDEIDTGVSGKTAEMMAQIMKEMGSHGRQVISITHLPQIAALGSVHYKVEKNETSCGTTSKMRQLNKEERVREIAQMLSGSDVSEAAIQNAKELLKY